MPKLPHLIVIAFLLAGTPQAFASSAPVVMELFTSQGCSSCPAADALLTQLAAKDSALLPLSLHVHYWDYLGWKDTYSSPLNTQRQKGYQLSLGVPQIFTPQLIVNGTASVVGSDEGQVTNAINRAKNTPSAVDILMTRDKSSGDLTVSVSSKDHSIVNGTFDVAEIDFDRYAKTDVKIGENGGHVLESINNVTAIRKLGNWQNGQATYTIPAKNLKNNGMAVIVQEQPMGRIIGAAYYLKP